MCTPDIGWPVAHNRPIGPMRPSLPYRPDAHRIGRRVPASKHELFGANKRFPQFDGPFSGA